MAEESLLDVFLYETVQSVETLEEIMISAEKNNVLNEDEINQVFRIMHTIKGSSAMMSFNGLSDSTHSMEDLFAILRDYSGPVEEIDWATICDLVLRLTDFIKGEIDKIASGDHSEDVDKELHADICNCIETLKQLAEGSPDGSDVSGSAKSDGENLPSEGEPPPEASGQSNEPGEKNTDDGQQNIDIDSLACYKIHSFFDDGCMMENLRAFGMVVNLQKVCLKVETDPAELDDDSCEKIIKDGVIAYVLTDKPKEDVDKAVKSTLFLNSFESGPPEDKSLIPKSFSELLEKKSDKKSANSGKKSGDKKVLDANHPASFISVNLAKLDKLLDLVGEVVIAESMVLQNPDLRGYMAESLEKASRHLRKLTHELQDVVMSIRMVPVVGTFQKMQRIVRDMNKKMGKNVRLMLRGEETEIDKNIIDGISDPLMHIIRNAIDHGIEEPEERERLGKKNPPTVTLSASSSGSDIIIQVKDNGRGLSREKILQKAFEKGIITKTDIELSDKEVFSLVLLPGFSTKENVTEFSGRGVGMDVVKRSIDLLGGTVTINSKLGKGTTVILKIPLTLAIISGMEVSVGESGFIVPIANIRESFKAKQNDIIIAPDGAEMVMVRGECYSIIRLNNVFDLSTDVENIEDGILIMLENGNKKSCIFVDRLVGEQQVVAKALPNYITRIKGEVLGVSGCSMLGDGSINLILDTREFC